MDWQTNEHWRVLNTEPPLFIHFDCGIRWKVLSKETKKNRGKKNKVLIILKKEWKKIVKELNSMRSFYISFCSLIYFIMPSLDDARTRPFAYMQIASSFWGTYVICTSRTENEKREKTVADVRLLFFRSTYRGKRSEFPNDRASEWGYTKKICLEVLRYYTNVCLCACDSMLKHCTKDSAEACVSLVVLFSHLHRMYLLLLLL